MTIDVEASGFGRGSYPIEIGIAIDDQSSRCFLIKPLPDWTHWDPTAERVHGISRRILEAVGRPAVEVACDLNEVLAGQTVFSDGWSFDISWVGHLYDALDIVQAFRIETVTSLFSPGDYELWNETKARVTAELGLSRHRASSDAMIVQQTLSRLNALDQR